METIHPPIKMSIYGPINKGVSFITQETGVGKEMDRSLTSELGVDKNKTRDLYSPSIVEVSPTIENERT